MNMNTPLQSLYSYTMMYSNTALVNHKPQLPI